ncbi:hypothetical protein ACFSC4_31285 [Deinococcus malanensis]|uniref:hypothetical protein n=1 Tax=Deinococcus malanensis TaxID=1706855 RepID=UPI00363C1382
MYGLTYGVKWSDSADASAGISLGRVVVTKRTRDTFRPEIALARGPRNMTDPAEGDEAALFSWNWALAWTMTAGLKLFQQVSGAWVEVQPGAPFPNMPSSARHVALAFDQSARHMFGWEDDGQVRVRQWSLQTQEYIFRGPFPGVDPVLLNDIPLTYDIPASDVLLFYLSADRLRVCARVQRENYEVEHTMLTLPEPGVLDQVVVGQYRYQIYGATLAGVRGRTRQIGTPYRCGITCALAWKRSRLASCSRL